MEQKKDIGFKIVDILLLIGVALPMIFAMVLKILFNPASDGINVTGALIYFTIPMPIQNLPITEAQVNSWLVLISIFFLCLYFTHGLSVKANLRRQLIVEWIVEKAQGLVNENMGEFFKGYVPFVTAILGLSAFSSLMSLLGLFAPTSDLNVVAGWAVLVFVLITCCKARCGPITYIKSFGEPMPLLSPLNIISEVSTPISMAFRHYGNVLSGAVISVLVASGLQGLTKLLLGWLPGVLGDIPFLQIGIPAILSIYFDIFSGVLQAYIFAILTMLYVSGAFPMEEYLKRKQARKSKKQEENLC